MQKYIKNYLEYHGLIQGEWIACEVCSKTSVDIHHIIPREFRYHPTVVLSNYDIENGYNLMFLPTSKGACILNLHTDRPKHFNCHRRYNRYVAIQ